VEAPRHGQEHGRGTDLIDQIRTGLLAPDLVVDVKKIQELHVLELSSVGLRVGAAVPCSTLYRDREIEAAYTALAESCRLIGGIQIQNAPPWEATCAMPVPPRTRFRH